jgi:hypothetical protein
VPPGPTPGADDAAPDDRNRMMPSPLALPAVLALAATALALPATLRVQGRAPFLMAVLVAAGASIVVVFIGLSVVERLTPGAIVVSQTLLALTVVGGWITAGRPALPSGLRPPSLRRARTWARANPTLAVLLAVAGPALMIQLFMAVAVAPNNWDAMHYHLARPAYWLQYESAKPIPAGSARQVYNPPNAEMLKGWTLAVTGTDRFVQLVQWTALLGIATAIFSGARLLAFSSTASAFAAALFATMPQPLLQATTAQNDLVVTFFLAAAAFFAVRGLRDRSPSDIVFAAVAGGLAVGTKGTALIAGPSLLLIVLVAAIGYRPGPRTLAAAGGLALAGLLALGIWSYAYAVPTTGTLVGSERSGIPRRAAPVRNLAETVRTFSDFPDPLPPRAPITLTSASAAAGVDRWVNTLVNEDFSAFGPVGLLFFLPVVLATAFARRAPPARRTLALASLAYLLLMGLEVQSNPWMGRTLIPMVALGAPLLALVAGRRRLAAVAVALAVVVTAACVFNNQLKPLARTPANNVLLMDRIEQQTLARKSLEPLFRRIDAALAADAPLGLAAGRNSWDYPLFGERRERRVIRMPYGEVSYATMERLGLAGIVLGDIVDVPPGVSAINLGANHYLVLADPDR